MLGVFEPCINHISLLLLLKIASTVTSLAQTVEIFHYPIMQTSDMPCLSLALFQIWSHLRLLRSLRRSLLLCLRLEINAAVTSQYKPQVIIGIESTYQTGQLDARCNQSSIHFI